MCDLRMEAKGRLDENGHKSKQNADKKCKEYSLNLQTWCQHINRRRDTQKACTKNLKKEHRAWYVRLDKCLTYWDL